MKHIILTTLLLICCFSLYADEPELDEDGNPIILPDLASPWSLSNGQGLEVDSEDLKGKPYVLHFWATWCPYCKKLQSGLDVISKGYVDKGIPTYAVSFWENPRAKPVKEMKSRGLTLPVLIEGDAVAKQFSVMGTPTTIFINGEGEIVYVHMLSNPNDPQIRVAYESLLKSMATDD
ncbi:TlpA disulfide reductase family protein [Psychrosphaera algicola]|uniref:TlpA disulfide reductase family protein n=1 Tax=Psychrosphaera algicola TaxID=3023714 RepID=A0ABT5FDY6_9GAMM|nr:TlpA disulfide reductase family protein [Psychrosphaera sp. G1-22]MDC2889556.1 TlpA disulfide reductase family protein [Psychrosphaera sp. G1-22]